MIALTRRCSQWLAVKATKGGFDPSALDRIGDDDPEFRQESERTGVEEVMV